MKQSSLFATLPLLLLPLTVGAATIDFEEFDADKYSIADGNFVSQDVGFLLNYNATYGSWDGIAVSAAGWKKPTASNYTDQFYLAGDGPTVAVVNNYAVVYDPGAYGVSPEIDLPDDLATPQSVLVTNTAYTWATIKLGDSYGMSTPFADGSWYKLTATGYNAEGAKTGATDFYLADYRDSDAAKHYVLTDFTKMDLTSLGDDVKTIKFTIASSDTGKYGINTPTYFAFDNLVVTGTRLWDGKTYTKASTWYGDVYACQTGAGWIYSYGNAAFQYVTGTEADAWVYDKQLGWYWTSADTYSYIYISMLKTWAYYYQGTPASADARTYYIYNTAFKDSLPNYPYATAAQIAGWLK
jgi:hypothetical protein